jgi:allantoinase
MKAEWDVLFTDGTIVTGEGLLTADLAVAEGRIAKLGRSLNRNASEIVSASDFYIFPGFIDAHVHFNEPGREHWEGLWSGSRSLAAGGGVAFFDMPLNASPPTLTRQDFDRKKACAETKSALDFGLWGGLTPINLDTMEELADAGVIGFKAFMSRSGTDDFPNATPKVLQQGMKIAASRGLPVGVHAEDDEMTANLARQLRQDGRITWRDYLDSRPIKAELEAIRIALELAGESDCDLHIVHVSCPEGIELIGKARAQGVRATAETCPHYLLLTDEDVGLIGACAKCAPPLRDAERREKMWGYLSNGRIDTLASDHSPAPPEMKLSDDFFEVWGGISSCQHAFPLTLAEWRARDGAEGLRRFSMLAATNVADRFRLGPGKGQIKEGFDADLTLIDFCHPEKVSVERVLYRHPITPFLGWNSNAVVVGTWLRGRAVYRDGKIQSGGQPKLLTPQHVSGSASLGTGGGSY